MVIHFYQLSNVRSFKNLLKMLYIHNSKEAYALNI